MRRVGVPKLIISESFDLLRQSNLSFPKRRIVERTFAWLARYCPHSRDYEKSTGSAVAFTYIAMINLMSKRLAKL